MIEIGYYEIRNKRFGIWLDYDADNFSLVINSNNKKIDDFLLLCDLYYYMRQWLFMSSYRTPVESLLEQFEIYIRKKFRTGKFYVDDNKVDSIFMLQELK